MLAQFCELSGDVKTFLANHSKDELLTKMSLPEFLAHLAYFADIFEVLNELSQKLQGRQNNVIHQADSITAFIAALQLLGRWIQDSNVTQFHRLSEVFREGVINQELKAEVTEHLNTIFDEFQWHFSDINTNQITMALAREPSAM